MLKSFASFLFLFVLISSLVFSFGTSISSAEGFYNIQTKTGGDGSTNTVIPGAGTNSTVTTETSGKTTIKDSEGKTTASYQATPVITTPSDPNSGFTTIPGAGGTYVLLAPIETFFPGGTIDVKGAGLGGYLNGLYKAGIAIATGLALIMIVVGGLEYVSTDSIQGKSNGRERIKNALVGLLLALTSYLILQQINPNLLKSDLQVESTGSIGTIEKVDVEFTEGVSIASGPVIPTQTQETLSNFPQSQNLVNGIMQDSGVPGVAPQGGGQTIGGGVLSNSGVASRIVQSARNNLNVSTCMVVTEGGKKGCGYAFGKIMSEAGITFKNLNSSQVLSTTNIYSVLASDSRFRLVAVNNTSSALPGDIIISPTTGSNVGHVGIVELAQAGRIISNSSSAASIQDYFTGQKWLNYYGGKGLKTYLFRYK